MSKPLKMRFYHHFYNKSYPPVFSLIIIIIFLILSFFFVTTPILIFSSLRHWGYSHLILNLSRFKESSCLLSKSLWKQFFHLVDNDIMFLMHLIIQSFFPTLASICISCSLLQYQIGKFKGDGVRKLFCEIIKKK